MYSDMSTRMSADGSAKRNLASARASSVLPTPVGPEKMNEPIGRLRVLEAGAASAGWRATTALMASSWPTTDPCSSSSIRSRREVSASCSRVTGMPVQRRHDEGDVLLVDDRAAGLPLAAPTPPA